MRLKPTSFLSAVAGIALLFVFLCGACFVIAGLLWLSAQFPVISGLVVTVLALLFATSLPFDK